MSTLAWFSERGRHRAVTLDNDIQAPGGRAQCNVSAPCSPMPLLSDLNELMPDRSAVFLFCPTEQELMFNSSTARQSNRQHLGMTASTERHRQHYAGFPASAWMTEQACASVHVGALTAHACRSQEVAEDSRCHVLFCHSPSCASDLDSLTEPRATFPGILLSPPEMRCGCRCAHGIPGFSRGCWEI